MPRIEKTPAQDLRVLVSCDTFTRFGYWKPGMEKLHSRLLRVLRANRVEVTEQKNHEIAVSPQQWCFARALARVVTMQESVTLAELN